MVAGIHHHHVAVAVKGDTGRTVQLARTRALGAPFAPKSAVQAETGNAMRRFVADVEIVVAVGNQLYRPDELPVVRPVAANLLQVVRLLFHVLHRPYPDQRNAFRAAQNVARILTEGDVRRKVRDTAHAQGLQIRVPGPQQAVWACHNPSPCCLASS